MENPLELGATERDGAIRSHTEPGWNGCTGHSRSQRLGSLRASRVSLGSPSYLLILLEKRQEKDVENFSIGKMVIPQFG